MDMRKQSTSFALGALLALALGVTIGAGAAPYKWVDKDGRVHYSDKPPPGAKAEPVELKPLTEVSSQPVPQNDGASAAPADPAAVPTEYASMSITSPADGSTHRDPSAAITVGVALEPALMEGDTIEYTLDGKVVASPLTGVERGTHRIGARVLSAGGGERIAANAITIHVHQNTVPAATPPKKQPKKKP